jgi:hypothetical protein
VRDFARMGSQGLGVAKDIARGAGIDFSLGGALHKRMGLETRATDLGNSGFMPGDKSGRNSARVNARDLMADAQAVGDKYAMDPEKAMEGLQSFTGKTGDLKTARDILDDMARLSKATGTSMEDMVSAAGEVALGLGDVKNKSAAIGQVMKVFAGQGKEGAIEVKDQSKYAAILAAGAGQMQGDRGAAMGDLGAMIQMSRAHGGAKNAPAAFAALGAFIDSFSKTERRKQMKLKGVGGIDKAGRINVEEFMVSALTKTGGDEE